MNRITAAALGTALGTVLGLALLVAGERSAVAAPASRVAAVSPAALAGVPSPQSITPAVSPAECLNGSSQVPQPTSTTVKQAPWAENALDFEQAWPFTQGSGITVAVVDSGVNWNPQLAGRVSSIDLTGTGVEDCVGHGTGVAGIIAASDEMPQGNEFAGVAPQANILSVKVTNSDTFPPGGDTTLADGIHDAAALGAKVISVSVQSRVSTTALAAAVEFAQSKGAVVVAAGGNDIPTSTGGFIKGPFYPASNRGVLSVGAIQQTGALAGFSDLNSDIQVTAPGLDVTSLTPNGYAQYDGTSFATPFVSGVAALLRAYSGSLTESQVVGRIVATADGNAGAGTGSGMVNPLQAVTGLLPPVSTRSPVASRPRSVSVFRALPPDTGTRNDSMLVTVSSVGGAALLVIACLVIIQGRRRGWRPGRGPDPEPGVSGVWRGAGRDPGRPQRRPGRRQVSTRR